MQTDQYVCKYDGMEISNNRWIVSGDGVYFSYENRHRAEAVTAALNVAYLLGKLEYLQSKTTDQPIP